MRAWVLAGALLLAATTVQAQTMTLWIWGQSGASNAHAAMTTAQPGSMAYVADGRFVPLADPVWGAQGRSGSWMPLLADDLRGRPHPETGEPIERVIVVAGAMAGARMQDWMPGGILLRPMLDRFRDALAHGVTPDAMIYQQGESDSGADASTQAWRSGFFAMLSAVRDLGVTAPIYVPLSTYCRENPGRSVIRAAQWSVADGISIRHGPDFDALVPPIYRYDGCHLLGTGQDIEARAWADTLTGE
jgi:hypothetical protein